MLNRVESFFSILRRRLAFKESLPLLLILAFFSFGIELVLGLDLISGRLNMLQFLFWHSLVSVVIASIAWCAESNQFLLILFAFVLSMGPTGSLLSLVIVFLSYILKPFTPSIETLLEEIAPDVSKPASQVLFERLYYKQNQFVKVEETLSFSDIMAYGSLNQKRLAIEKMLRYFRPEFTPLLRAATRSQKNVLRVQAATALQALDHQFHENMIFLSQKAQRPDGSSEDWLRYAIHCKNYAESGIADEERYRLLIQNAIRAFEQVKNQGNHDVTISFALAELYTASSKPHLALEHASLCIQKDNPCFCDAIYLVAHILFDQGSYQELRELATRYLPKVRELEAGNPQITLFLSPWSMA